MKTAAEKRNIKKANLKTIDYILKYAEKTKQKEPDWNRTLCQWIFNYSCIAFKFAYALENNNHDEIATYTSNKANKFSIALVDILKSELQEILNLHEYKKYKELAIIPAEKEKARQIEIEKLQKIEHKKQLEKERIEHKNKLEKAKQDYILDIKISAELFLELCNEYNIKLPLRTLGWAQSSLNTISCDNYTWIKRTKTSRQSDSIYKYRDLLTDLIKESLSTRFCFIQFAIYYLIANLEQGKTKKSKKTTQQPNNNFSKASKLFNSAMENIKNDDFNLEKIENKKLKQDKIIKDILTQNKITEICTRASKNYSTYEYNIIMRASSLRTAILPPKNNLPIHIPTTQEKPAKTTVKTTENKAFLISYKSTLQLEYSQNIKYSLDYKQVLSLPILNSKQDIELAEYREMPMEAKIENHRGLDNFFELYQARLKQKRTEKRLSKEKFSFIPALSSVAIMLFVVLHCLVSIPGANNTMQNLANIGKTTEQLLADNQNDNSAVKSTANLSDNRLSGTNTHLDNKTSKSTPFDGLNLISLVMVFGSLNSKRKEKSMEIVEIEYKCRLNEVKIIKTFISKLAYEFAIKQGHKLKLIRNLPILDYYWHDHLHDNAICYFSQKPKRIYDLVTGTLDLRTNSEVLKDTKSLKSWASKIDMQNEVSYGQLLSGYTKKQV